MRTRLASILATLGLLTLFVSAWDIAQGRVPLPLARVAEAAGWPARCGLRLPADPFGRPRLAPQHHHSG